MHEQVENSAIYTLDALYHEPNLAAIHLVVDDNRVAVVDTGTQYSLDEVKTALSSLNLSFENVELIILTHIHLDHAGGASTLMQHCPNAKLIVHEKGARHMADPSKLIAGTIAVYGEAEYKKLYGEITAIDESRMVSPKEGETIKMGGREFSFYDSPGHASHHFCIHDHSTNSFFTGDTLGIAYPALREENHTFLMPTTTPVQFNPEALHNSIDKVMVRQPNYLYLTHYGAVKPNAGMIAGLHEQIDDFVMLTQQTAEKLEGKAFEEELAKQIFDYLFRRAKNELPNASDETIQHWIKMDSLLDSQGLAFWWQYRRG